MRRFFINLICRTFGLKPNAVIRQGKYHPRQNWVRMDNLARSCNVSIAKIHLYCQANGIESWRSSSYHYFIRPSDAIRIQRHIEGINDNN